MIHKYPKMDDLLNLTLLPNRITESERIQNEEIFHIRKLSDRESFDYLNEKRTNNNGGNFSKAAKDAYKKLNSFLRYDGKSNFDLSILIDGSKLSSLGIDPYFLSKYFFSIFPNKINGKLSHKKIREICFFSIYFNTFGMNSNSLIQIILKLISDNSACEDSKSELRTRTIKRSWVDETSTTYETIMKTLNIAAIKKACDLSMKDHYSESEVKNILDLELDDFLQKIKQLINSPSLNVETCLNEIMYQFIEPRKCLKLLENTLENFQDVESVIRIANQRDYVSLAETMSNRTVNFLENKIAAYRDDLFKLVLPRRYRIIDQNSAASLDVLLNILLGASLNEIRIFFDLISFSIVEGLSNSDEILKNIQEAEKIEELENIEEKWISMIKIWRKQTLFVLWFNLFKNITGVSIEIGRSDDYLPEDDGLVVGSPESHKRKIPPQTIYFHNNEYFLLWYSQNVKYSFKSKCYKKVLEYFFSHPPK